MASFFKKFFSKKENFILLGILLFASFLRFYRVADYMTFLGDEGRDDIVVYNILHGHFTLLGPTASVGGFFMGPIYYYFMAPFLWLSRFDPTGPSYMVALFGVLAVLLLYKVAKEFFDTKTALIASLLFAISPLVIAYSRSSWNPNIMPFFTLLTVYVLYKAIAKNSWKLLFLTGILYGIDIQLHYTELFLGLAIIIYVFLTKNVIFNQKSLKQRIIESVKVYTAIFIGFILGWSPFLAFEVRHGFPDIKSITSFIFHSGQTGGDNRFFAIVPDVFFRLFGRLVANFPPPEQYHFYSNTIFSFWYYSALLLALCSTGLFIFKLYGSFKNKNEDYQKYLILFLWFFTGIILFGFYKKPIYDYYFEYLFPLPFMLVGLLFSTILKTKNKVGSIGKIVIPIILGMIVALNLNSIPFKSAPNRQLAQAKEIATFVISKTDEKAFNFALITGGNSDQAYRYFFKLWNRDPMVIQNIQIDPKRTSVADQLLVICEDPKCEPLGNSLWEVAGFGRAEIAGKWDVSVVKVYKLVHYKGK